METTLAKTFENAEFGTVRVIMIDNVPWFVGRDVATALGYSNASKAVANHVDEEDRRKEMLEAFAQNGKVVAPTIIINESGLYSLILSSKLENAKKFKRWVTSEVLPSIRKTGSYGTAAPAAPYVLIPKFFRGKQVITIKGAAIILNVSRALIEEVINKPTANLHEGQDYYRLKGDKRAEFKHDNPSIPAAVHHIIAILKSGFEKICSYLKINEVPQIFTIENLAVELGLMPKELQPQQVQAPPPQKSQLEQIRDDLINAQKIVMQLYKIYDRVEVRDSEALGRVANILNLFVREKSFYIAPAK